MHRSGIRTWLWMCAAALVALSWTGGVAQADGPPGKGKRVGHELHRGKGHSIGRGRGHGGHAVPELDPTAAGAAMLLLGGVGAAVIERRRRAS